MLYLDSKWASLIPFAKVADLMKEVLPVGGLQAQKGAFASRPLADQWL